MSEAKKPKTSDGCDDIFQDNPSTYQEFSQKFKVALDSALNSPDRFQALSKREERSDLPPAVLKTVSRGKYLTLHRGLQLVKTAEDLLVYQQMFWHVKPRTIIELGTYAGGSAVWIGDMVKTLGLDCHCYSVDNDHSLIPDEARRLKPDNVTFLLGDCFAIDETFTPKMLSELPHPLIIIDDAHVNVFNNLSYFHKYLQVGDYIVLEDTNPDGARDIGMGLCKEFEALGNTEKLNDLKKFVAQHEEEYAVDSYFTDFYGYNFQSQWNSIVRRMK